jgi:hypothetical protein
MVEAHNLETRSMRSFAIHKQSTGRAHLAQRVAVSKAHYVLQSDTLERIVGLALSYRIACWVFRNALPKNGKGSPSGLPSEVASSYRLSARHYGGDGRTHGAVAGRRDGAWEQVPAVPRDLACQPLSELQLPGSMRTSGASCQRTRARMIPSCVEVVHGQMLGSSTCVIWLGLVHDGTARPVGTSLGS